VLPSRTPEPVANISDIRTGPRNVVITRPPAPIDGGPHRSRTASGRAGGEAARSRVACPGRQRSLRVVSIVHSFTRHLPRSAPVSTNDRMYCTLTNNSFGAVLTSVHHNPLLDLCRRHRNNLTVSPTSSFDGLRIAIAAH